MIDTALQSNLKKNELMVCLFLMGKLLGYGKGIFERKTHDRYEHEYSIAPHILADFDGIFLRQRSRK